MPILFKVNNILQEWEQIFSDTYWEDDPFGPGDFTWDGIKWTHYNDIDYVLVPTTDSKWDGYRPDKVRISFAAHPSFPSAQLNTTQFYAEGEEEPVQVGTYGGVINFSSNPVLTIDLDWGSATGDMVSLEIHPVIADDQYYITNIEFFV